MKKKKTGINLTLKNIVRIGFLGRLIFLDPYLAEYLALSIQSIFAITRSSQKPHSLFLKNKKSKNKILKYEL